MSNGGNSFVELFYFRYFEEKGFYKGRYPLSLFFFCGFLVTLLAADLMRKNSAYLVQKLSPNSFATTILTFIVASICL